MCTHGRAGNQHFKAVLIPTNSQQQRVRTWKPSTTLASVPRPSPLQIPLPSPAALEFCAESTYRRPANRAKWSIFFAAGRQTPPATAMQRSPCQHSIVLAMRRRRTAAPTLPRSPIDFPRAGFRRRYFCRRQANPFPPASMLRLDVACKVLCVPRRRRAAAPNSPRPCIEVPPAGLRSRYFCRRQAKSPPTPSMQRSRHVFFVSRRRRAAAPMSLRAWKEGDQFWVKGAGESTVELCFHGALEPQG
ncbi:hypothetical protein C8R47DRAFT_498995 [Mycena vitilis]|nr:hypothetical protein C8R47DRAFT_498995 [Mycena vitilis]